MKLYVDEDSVHGLLVRLLERAGHDVQVPSGSQLIGRSDAVNLRYSISSRRSVISANHDDFRELHDLIRTAGGTHPGILIVRYDNDTRRDLTKKGIVVAIENLLAANVPLENE